MTYGRDHSQFYPCIEKVIAGALYEESRDMFEYGRTETNANRRKKVICRQMG